MPGSGKSFIARRFAYFTGIPVFDTDDIIEKEYGKSIVEIFKTGGEEVFREYERDIIKEISKKEEFIVATGGGLPCYQDNIRLINKSGISVYLKADTETLLHRIKKNPQIRPLINTANDNEIIKYLKNTLNERRKYYEQAHYTVNAAMPADEILKSEPFNL